MTFNSKSKKIYITILVLLLLTTASYVYAQQVFTNIFVSMSYIYQALTANKPLTIQKIKPFFDAYALETNINARLQYLSDNVPTVKFEIYKVQMRDNLWKIARRHGYSVHTIIGCNPQLETYNVNYGEQIILPSIGGTLHKVQNNDTWTTVANRYQIAESTIKNINSGVKTLRAGGLLFIPGKMPDISLLNAKMREKYELRSLFVSPLGGRLSSVFGKRVHPVTGKASIHGGVDIAVKTGTWVGAAADGVVILASHNA